MRRTPKEAARTRAAILDAGLECFDRLGVAQSTLQQIAQAAGVTRGAVYHHFAGKSEIFRAIRDDVSLPLLDEADTTLLKRGDLDPLDRVRTYLVAMLDTVESDTAKRRALTVMFFRCEYSGEMRAELAAGARNVNRLVNAFRGAYEQAREAGRLAAGLEPGVAALETVAFIDGLLREWILNGPRSSVRKNARAAIESHVRLRRGTARSNGAGRRRFTASTD